jgi:hypothetical protein
MWLNKNVIFIWKTLWSTMVDSFWLKNKEQFSLAIYASVDWNGNVCLWNGEISTVIQSY